jgi:hypothetical protein
MTQALSSFLASSLNVELVHIILKGIKKFSDIQMTQKQGDEDSYELMRICRLKRIKIKDPSKWDKAQYSDFVGNQFSQKKSKKKSVYEEKLLTINEEVTIFEYAPKKF